jgi:uncharacterized protein YecA (UPF0149 family)
LAEAYQGDEAFSRLLADVDCPVPLHRVKAVLAGALAATNMPSIDVIFRALWNGQDPNFTRQEQVTEFTGGVLNLWNHLASRGDAPYELTKLPFPESMADIAAYGAVRVAEVEGFFQGLDLGGTDPDTLPPREMEALAKGAGFYRAFAGLAEQEQQASAEEVKESIGLLAQMDAVLVDAISFIQTVQRQRRAAAVAGLPMRRTAKTGRNEPCPCGSGKKYKYCCGRS